MAALAPPLWAQQAEPAKPQAPAAEKARAPVVIEDRELFYVQERVLSFSPEDRAKAISDRIRRLSKDPLFRPETLAVVDGESTTDIVAGEFILMSVSERDAAAAGRTRQELANDYATRIRTAMQELHDQYSLQSLLLGAAYALLATVVLLALFRLFRFVFPKLYELLESWRGTRIQSIRLQKLELIPAARIVDLLTGIFRLLRLAASLVLLYFYVSLVLGFFPWTRGYAAVLVGYVVTPLKLVGSAVAAYLPNVFFIVVILVVAYYATRFVKLFFAEVDKGTIQFPEFYPEWAWPTYRIVRFLILALTLVMIFPYLPGSQSPAFQGVSLFLGLLLSLGSTSAVANVIAGVILTYMRAFKVGDRVKIADTIGDVVEKTLLVTRVRTTKNVDITIANAMVLSSHIINYSASAQEHGLILHTGVTIGYDAPWRKVHALLQAAADATENLLKEPKPFVLQTALDDFYVHYEINAYTDKPNQMVKIYSDLHQNIQDKFNEGDVEIMSPHFEAQRDGSGRTIPRDYLPKDYVPPTYSPPAFRSRPGENPSSDKEKK